MHRFIIKAKRLMKKIGLVVLLVLGLCGEVAPWEMVRGSHGEGLCEMQDDGGLHPRPIEQRPRA